MATLMAASLWSDPLRWMGEQQADWFGWLFGDQATPRLFGFGMVTIGVLAAMVSNQIRERFLPAGFIILGMIVLYQGEELVAEPPPGTDAVWPLDGLTTFLFIAGAILGMLGFIVQTSDDDGPIGGKLIQFGNRLAGSKPTGWFALGVLAAIALVLFWPVLLMLAIGFGIPFLLLMGWMSGNRQGRDSR